MCQLFGGLLPFNLIGDDFFPPPPLLKSVHKSNVFSWYKSILWWRYFRAFMVYYYDRQNLTDKSIQSSDIEQVQCLQARLIDYYIIL
jgi:hypothetical protein